MAKRHEHALPGIVVCPRPKSSLGVGRGGARRGLNLGPTPAILGRRGAVGGLVPPAPYKGDVVQAIDGVKVKSPQDVTQLPANRSPDEDVLVRLNRVLQTPVHAENGNFDEAVKWQE